MARYTRICKMNFKDKSILLCRGDKFVCNSEFNPTFEVIDISLIGSVEPYKELIRVNRNGKMHGSLSAWGLNNELKVFESFGAKYKFCQSENGRLISKLFRSIERYRNA